MAAPSLGAEQRRHARQIRELLRSDDGAVVYQGCELLTALQDAELVLHFALESAFHAEKGMVIGAPIRGLVQAPHQAKVAFHLLLLLIALRRRRPPKALLLRYADIGAVGARKLAACTQLRVPVLDLRYNQLTDAGVQALAAAPWLSSVRTLRLHENQIGPGGVCALMSSSNLGPLQRLDLRDNPIGAVGARAIAEAPKMASLSWLHLYEGDIGDAGAKALGASPHLPLRIRRFWRARA